MISPVISYVVVDVPISTSAIYSLSSFSRKFPIFVNAPTPTTKSPSAIGSSVPKWPIFLSLSILVRLFTTSREIDPFLYLLILLYPSYHFQIIYVIIAEIK